MSISPDEHFACCQLLYRVTLHLRSHAGQLKEDFIRAVAEATHNIPLFLQSPTEDGRKQVQWDIDYFDSRHSNDRPTINLRDTYDDAIARFNCQQQG